MPLQARLYDIYVCTCI